MNNYVVLSKCGEILGRPKWSKDDNVETGSIEAVNKSVRRTRHTSFMWRILRG
jgi:hypothetical protein